MPLHSYFGKPYVSVAFVNRNDGYGGDFDERVGKFIEYYAHWCARWPGLFEFVICDWNPPSDRPRLRDAFAWHKLGDVLHVEVPPDVHEAIRGINSRVMLDYIGRNVAARHGRGRFTLVMNQDIFISESILRLIARRRLDERAFYRADRCDFNFEPCRNLGVEEFEKAALDNVFEVHRRHHPDGRPISVPVTARTLVAEGSKAVPGDRTDSVEGVIVCDAGMYELVADRRREREFARSPERRQALAEWRHEFDSPAYQRKFFLHSNASGDFILAPRAAFFEIQGMLEAKNFYFHLDSYALVQLFAAGYRQVIFAQPHRIYHADHDRSGRTGYREPLSWSDHEIELSRILREAGAFRLNDRNWGLGGFDLPRTRLIQRN